MKLRNEISEKERSLSPMCAICDEYAFGRVDRFEWSCVAGNAPLYCEYCVDNWCDFVAIRDGKLQIGKEEVYDGA